MVEDNILKQIIGFDPAVFSVDMLRKICGKLGFVSRKYTKIERMSSTSTVSSTVRNILPDSNKKDIVPSSSTSSADTNQESFCCAGEYCWKKDNPKNFTVECSDCKLMCHEYCSKINNSTNSRTCEQCAHK